MSETLAELKQWLRLVPVGDFPGATYKDRMRNAVRFIAAAERAEQERAEQECAELRETVARLRRLAFESLYHLRMDHGAKAYHDKVQAELRENPDD